MLHNVNVGFRVDIWQLIQNRGDKVNTYELSVLHEENPHQFAIPVRFHMIGFNIISRFA